MAGALVGGEFQDCVGGWGFGLGLGWVRDGFKTVLSMVLDILYIITIGVRRGVFKGVIDICRLPACRT